MRTFLIQHVVGILAQVASALPFLLITVLLAHTSGLEYSGRFTIVVGLSAFAFSLASWGLRTHIVIDRLEKFAAVEYLAARSLAASVAVIATIVAGRAVAVPYELLVAVTLFRSCDTLIDLNLAFDQVRRSGSSALNRYAFAHSMKVLTLVAIVGVGYFLAPRHTNDQIGVVGVLVTIGAAAALVKSLRELETRPLNFAKIRSVLSQAKWFASAEIGSAGITSAPRVSLAWLYSGKLLGVAGTSLSVAGFFGMAFYTSWLRFLPRFSATTNKGRAVRNLVLETFVIAALLALGASTLLPYLVGFVFGFHEQNLLTLSRDVLCASVAFFAAMNLVNLYKISSNPWMETASYIAALVVTSICAWVFPNLRHTPELLWLAGGIMFCLSFPNIVAKMNSRESPPERATKLAVFARIASRPVPRVARMMRVARDAGYECRFLGAMRDEGLPREDRWEGWSVVRLGPHFPLLNGTRPLIYLKSVIGYNIALYRALKQSRPVLIHCSDSETMPAAIVYRVFSNSRLIFNIHDNIAQRYNIPTVVASLLNAIEGCLVLCSDITAVPEEFRRSALPSWCRSKVVTIRNTPVDPGSSEPRPVSSRIRIFFGGWLDWGRGLRPLMELASNEPRIELRIAGEGAPSVVDEIKRNSNVVYLGFLDHDEAMAETAACHFVSAFYDPSRTINRFAASNKIADALAVGRPILMNCELEIAKQLGPVGCALCVPYTKIAHLADKVVALADDRDTYNAACAKARAAYDANYAWEAVRDRMHTMLASDQVPVEQHNLSHRVESA